MERLVDVDAIQTESLRPFSRTSGVRKTIVDSLAALAEVDNPVRDPHHQTKEEPLTEAELSR